MSQVDATAKDLEATDSTISISGLTDSVDVSGVSGLEDIINISDNGIKLKDDSKGK